MQRLAVFIGAMAIALAAAGSYLAATAVANYVERSTTLRVRETLISQDIDWATVRSNGLKVTIGGAAPSEASRFKALTAVKAAINSSRIYDMVKVVNPDDLHPPLFSLEILRNVADVSLIGLIPLKTGRENVLHRIEAIASDTAITDMLETADYAQPATWTAALDFALESLGALPRSKISVTPQKVIVTAITDSQQEKAATEEMLQKMRPTDVQLELHITAPRPVITPFSLRIIKDADGIRFDSCSTDGLASQKAILKAAISIGAAKDSTCRIGLGAPSPRWSEAVILSLKALQSFDSGELTFSDADITLIASSSTRQIDFDKTVYNLEQVLPGVFSVHAVLPPKPIVEGAEPKKDIPEFLVTKGPEGLVQMRGRLRDVRSKTSIHNFAGALFGGDNLHDTTRLNPDMPDGWPTRILAGLEALNLLHHGLLIVHPNMVDLRGISDRPGVKTAVTQIFSEKLGDKFRYQINVTYEPALNRQKVMPTPQQCVERINNILTEKQITFTPSSSTIDGNSIGVVERIASAMQDCSSVPMEIGGHTDSQGREAMNKTLSQSRAETVLDTLLSFDVLTSNLTAKGYGESEPIADNSTEEGRKTNRRIEFTLLQPAAEKPQKAAGGDTTAGAADASGAASETPSKTPDKKPEAKDGQN